MALFFTGVARAILSSKGSEEGAQPRNHTGSRPHGRGGGERDRSDAEPLKTREEGEGEPRPRGQGSTQASGETRALWFPRLLLKYVLVFLGKRDFSKQDSG